MAHRILLLLYSFAISKEVHFLCKYHHRLYNVLKAGVKSSKTNCAAFELRHQDFGRKWKLARFPSVLVGAQPFLCVRSVSAGNGATGEKTMPY